MKVLHIVGGSNTNGAFKGANILHNALLNLKINSRLLNDTPPKENKEVTAEILKSPEIRNDQTNSLDFQKNWSIIKEVQEILESEENDLKELGTLLDSSQYQLEETDNANVLLRAEVLNRINSRKKPAVIVTYPDALFEKPYCSVGIPSKFLSIILLSLESTNKLIA